MHRAPRTAPRASALLGAVLLALLTVFAASGAGGPRPDPSDWTRAAALAAGRHGGPTTDHSGPTAPTAPAGPTNHTSASPTTPTPPTQPPAHAAPHADEQCPAACTAQAGTRQELRGERPAPPGQLAAATEATTVPRPAPTPTPPARAPAPASPGHPVPDRGRAPPAPSGT
ncbi:hypothetical protein ACF061_10280 [Streptomyces sp. NPDC015220]|uniref:hypothetical protein n=1 Tax=Streptomyces sp. NPDC015220 TaxID=3364947 RepID=UPI0036F91262